MRIQEYHVTWELEVSARSARAAATIARALMRDPAVRVATFTVFDDDGGPPHNVNLDDTEEDEREAVKED